MAKKRNDTQQYGAIICHIFAKHWTTGVEDFEFHRDELVTAAEETGVERPDNLGDVIYSFKFRRELPEEITRTAPEGKAWMIEGAGRSRYRFRLVDIGGTTFVPRQDIAATKIPDSTPEIIAAYALGDEQALLAKVRYNHLIDIFLGLTTYSLQNHIAHAGEGNGDKSKSTKSMSASIAKVLTTLSQCRRRAGPTSCTHVQTLQDVQCCRAKFPDLLCRPCRPRILTWTTM